MTAWKNKFINPNKYSRPQEKLKAVRKIVMHWTANYGAGAENHYKYFNNLKGRYASAHLFVDKSEALCIIPLNEIAYHANDGSYRGVAELKPNANYLSIGVEICVEKDGTFHPNTIARTVEVVAELCKMYNLDPLNDIVTHNLITKKMCPAPWVNKPAEFITFKAKVKAKMTPVATVKVEDKNRYRIKSGAYSTEHEAVLAKTNIGAKGIANTQYIQVYKDGSVWRWLTGTYVGRSNAEAALKRIKDEKIAGIGYVVED